jgi:two-component system, OmpR family, sensor kinase
MSENQDRDTLRRASVKVAWQIGAACTVMVVLLLAAAAVYLMNQTAHPEVPKSGNAAYTYLDTNDLLKAMIIAGLAGILFAGGIGWLSARSAIRPLGEALGLQRRFVQDASHELRTPLAILDARIQLAQRETTPESKPGQALARIRDDTATLTAIVNELLLAATGTRQTPSTETTDLAEVAASVAEGLQQIAGEQGITVEVSARAQPLARIEKDSLRRAVLALADNALAHTPSGGQITLATAVEKDQAVITVSDTGSGITGVDQARIFERFVRTTGADGTRGQRSFGIGLALVREITTSAGGTVEIARTGPQGTVMKLTLPLASP